MFEIKLNVAEFEARAKELGGALDQVPYALSRALNNAAFNARRQLVSDTWPSHVTVRNPKFLSAVLRVESSKKDKLQVQIYDSTPDQRAHLQLHALGGVKTPKREYLAVPAKDNILGVTLTARGASLKPAAVVSSTPRRALRIATIKRSGNKGIFVGRGGRLNLIYVLSKRAQIKATVPFYDDFYDIVRRDARLNFPAAMKQAMRTRIASKYR